MAKYSYSPDSDQNDPKTFRETLGTFGTTTNPASGENQLSQLQAKVRQGVKHVELALGGVAKGQFGALDTPDKYGFEQRRTIMQLAKLNQQTLSVHGSFNMTSFSGISQRGGFDEAERWRNMKEVDETIKFAAETAKQGAIVFHVHESHLQTPPGEINLPKHYLEWLKKNKPEDYKKLEKEYFAKDPKQRYFIDSPETLGEIRRDYEKLDKKQKEEFEKKYEKEIKDSGKPAYEYFHDKKKLDKMKIAPDLNPLIVVGDKIDKVERQQEFIDIKVLKDEKDELNDKEIDILKQLGVRTKSITIDDFQKANAIFSNSLPKEFKGKIDENDFLNLKKKLLVTYEKFLDENHYMQSQADKDFYEKLNETQVEIASLQKKSLETKYSMFKDELKRVRELEAESKDALLKLEKIDESTQEGKAARDAIKIHIAEKNREIQHLKYQSIGQEEYHELAKYDETMAQLNKQISELKDRKYNIKSLTDEIFDKNTSAIGHFGLKALSYQLELKRKSKEAEKKVKEINSEISKLEKEYDKASAKNDSELMNKININLMKEKSKLTQWVGLKDYHDIDVDKNPLYIAPENMIVGYGYMTNLEEYKAVIRESWQEFANKIQSEDPFYKKIREDYESETGKKLDEKSAYELAKKHIGGTFDNAHASVWIKHFKREKGESDESRNERFNKWLNDEAEKMAKEGIIKHVHLNDSLGKDDDHNLLGSGILDIHDLRARFRKAGIKEALIVEAGGRGSATNMHLSNAFSQFNPVMNYKMAMPEGGVSGVSDWINVTRDYKTRPQYSAYGMSYSTFRHVPPQQGQQKGEWSGTSFF